MRRSEFNWALTEVRAIWVHRPYAHTGITIIIPTPARRMHTTALTTLWAACSSAPAHGSTDTTAVVDSMGADITGADMVEGMVADMLQDSGRSRRVAVLHEDLPQVGSAVMRRLGISVHQLETPAAAVDLADHGVVDRSVAEAEIADHVEAQCPVAAEDHAVVVEATAEVADNRHGNGTSL